MTDPGSRHLRDRRPEVRCAHRTHERPPDHSVGTRDRDYRNRLDPVATVQVRAFGHLDLAHCDVSAGQHRCTSHGLRARVARRRGEHRHQPLPIGPIEVVAIQLRRSLVPRGGLGRGVRRAATSHQLGDNHGEHHHSQHDQDLHDITGRHSTGSAKTSGAWASRVTKDLQLLE
ncbi:MAG: hypothetical protein M5U19_22790 [Microthrixaceae bacterium]|nr:hypothetical protein [Microthrixaceae bacterium]